jgi:hypothetical protein
VFSLINVMVRPCETTWQFVTASLGETATAEPWDDGAADASPSTV